MIVTSLSLTPFFSVSGPRNDVEFRLHMIIYYTNALVTMPCYIFTNLLSLHPLSKLFFCFTGFILESSYMAISADMCICNKKNAWLEIKHVCTADQL